MEKPMCRRCLTREMDKAEYFENLHTLIANLEEDIRVENVVYEQRLAVCKNCDYLVEGMCGACGCFVELRAAIRENVCPYKKW